MKTRAAMCKRFAPPPRGFMSCVICLSQVSKGQEERMPGPPSPLSLGPCPPRGPIHASSPRLPDSLAPWVQERRGHLLLLRVSLSQASTWCGKGIGRASCGTGLKRPGPQRRGERGACLSLGPCGEKKEGKEPCVFWGRTVPPHVHLWKVE